MHMRAFWTVTLLSIVSDQVEGAIQVARNIFFENHEELIAWTEFPAKMSDNIILNVVTKLNVRHIRRKTLQGQIGSRINP